MLRKLSFTESRLEGGQMSEADTRRHIGQCFQDLDSKVEIEANLAYQRGRWREVHDKDPHRFDRLALEVLDEQIQSWADYSSRMEVEVAGQEERSDEDMAERAAYKVQVTNYVEVLKVLRDDLQEKEWKVEKGNLAKR